MNASRSAGSMPSSSSSSFAQIGVTANPAIFEQAIVGNDPDYAFLDLTTAAFDLSDRGVSGREQSGALEAFIFPERGVYKPGETIHLTAIVRDKKRVIPCAAYCEEEFGVAPGQKGKGMFVGVPCVLGGNGVEKIITFKMNDTEKKFMDESISHVRDLVGITKKLLPEVA
mgnify:CR=1 FL=1